MLILRLLPPAPNPHFVIGFAIFLVVGGTYLTLISTVLFRVGERVQDRLAKNRKNRRGFAFLRIRALTLWQRRHTTWQAVFRLIAAAVGIFFAVEGLEIIFLI